jgi:hypothetical protein
MCKTMDSGWTLSLIKGRQAAINKLITLHVWTRTIPGIANCQLVLSEGILGAPKNFRIFKHNFHFLNRILLQG